MTGKEAIERLLENARVTGLVDKIRASTFVMSADADKGDLHMALQLGIALLLDKPLLLILKTGAEIPQRLRDLADEIVEVDQTEHLNTDPVANAKVTAAINRMVEKGKAKER